MERLPETCTEISATLPLFAGYDLEAPEMEAVAKHLERCEECREACDRARRAREVLGTLRSEPGSRGEPGPDLWDGIRSQLITEGLLESGPRVARPFFSPRWWAGNAAAAAAVVIISFGVLRDSGDLSNTDPQPGTPATAQASSAGSVAALHDAADNPATDAAQPVTGAQPRSTRIPADASLVGHGTVPGRRMGGQGFQPRPDAAGQNATTPTDGQTRPLGELRRLEPSELGLYEQALQNARIVPLQVRQGGSANRQWRVSGIR
ncbi:MAG: hypothetical protein ACI8QZ_001614 [Chlamydiales bacterium]|jgi:hypothetical protein